jgi:predicted transcriptional regulator of viral defense system
LLAEWERARRSSITLDDVRQLVGPRAANDVVKALVRKHVLQRVARGIYLVRPFRSLPRPTSSSSTVTLATMLSGQPYYLGGLWALTHHRLTSQQYVSVLDAFVTRRRPPRDVGSSRVVFHVIRPTLMDHGIVSATVEGVDVRTSDVERTLLDILDHPSIAGNLRSALSMFKLALPRADLQKLTRYASAGSRSSTCQRLGVLLERRQASPRLLAPLRKRTEKTRSVLAMLPDRGMRGHLSKRWRVVENDF